MSTVSLSEMASPIYHEFLTAWAIPIENSHLYNSEGEAEYATEWHKIMINLRGIAWFKEVQGETNEELNGHVSLCTLSGDEHIIRVSYEEFVDLMQRLVPYTVIIH